MHARSPLITGLIASLAFAGAQQALAADRGDVAAGVVIGAILGGVLVSQRSAPAYEPQPVYRAPPPVVYYEPRPVYYEPRPVYYTPAPVYYVAEPRYPHNHWRKTQRRHHDDW
ncbi:hypothetical protein OU997_03350 [Pseudomonas sp. SL4(2022)]|uniref:hypothetical protein n=1 Tax=unclassified Pseudomonas TaxID=196821 RepID=UPI0021146B91|nr:MULTISPECIES: hypothetical protein [unclassified Pseudomonas]WAC45242.1 hypothetical protein OU997_03350 [Pseudomonas sp. SL4(2022)]